MAKRKALSAGQVEEACVLARMMGDPFRLRALLLVGEQGPISVTAICKHLETKQPTASYHLGLLKLANLVSTRRNGKQILYRLSDRFTQGIGWTALLRLHQTAQGSGAQ